MTLTELRRTFASWGFTTGFCLCVALAGVVAAPGLASEPAAGAPAAEGGRDVRAMSVPELLAEFHGAVELTRPHSQRRVDLVNALRRLAPQVVDGVRADLGNADAEVRKRALRSAAALGNGARPLAGAVATAASADPDAGVREAAVNVLCQLRDPLALGALVAAADDAAPGVRAAVVRNGRAALADAPFALAVRALADRDVHVRAAAARELSLRRDRRAAAYVAPLLADQTVLHYDERGGVRTAHRVCDEAVLGLEHHVNGTYPLARARTQAEYDALVAWWRDWWRQNGVEFDRAAYAEPEVARARH